MESSCDKYIIYFNTRDEMLKVDLRHVVYFQADRNYTDVYFANGVHETLTLGLITIEKMLDEPHLRGSIPPFIRIGRGYIVNPRYIYHINVLKQELLLSDMRTPNVYHLQVSREALKSLKDLYQH